MKETVCGVCERENCLVGYAQECIRKCLNNNVTFVEDGVKNIPLHGAIRDDASVELRRIRREAKSSQARIKEHLSSVLHSQEYQKYFQDAIVTIRDDRYVVPIKQEYRQYFPGIVHDQSASGSTLFIEPMAVVNLNNDVKQLLLAEKRELERILRALSQQIEKNKDVLLANCQLMALVDFTFAKARLARDMKGVEPLLNREGRTRLRGARHPLIAADKVVPIDVELGLKNRMLLITGPNTGGKTVSMEPVRRPRSAARRQARREPPVITAMPGSLAMCRILLSVSGSATMTMRL